MDSVTSDRIEAVNQHTENCLALLRIIYRSTPKNLQANGQVLDKALTAGRIEIKGLTRFFRTKVREKILGRTDDAICCGSVARCAHGAIFNHADNVVGAIHNKTALPGSWEDLQKFVSEVNAERDAALKILDPPIPDPDETLVLKTRGNSRSILLYLWKRGPISRDELRKKIWGKRKITDRGIDKAIEDLNLKFTQIIKTGCKTKVIRNGGMYYLQHPQK